MNDTHAIALALLDRSIRQQRSFVNRWNQPKSPLLFELVRALDNLFVGDMMAPPSVELSETATRSIQSFGVNSALAMMVPDELRIEDFTLFPSRPQIQRQADNLLFHCGILQRALKCRHELFHDLLNPTVRNFKNQRDKAIGVLLELHPKSAEYRSERIAYRSREWLQDLQYQADKPMEEALEKEHYAILPELVKNVEKYQNWGIAYQTSREIDDYFLEWGRLYLRRMWGQDLVGLDDRIGPSRYNEYLGVLVGLAGRAQKHLCYAAILSRRHPELDHRNLLTTFAPYHDFLHSLAKHLDADQLQIQQICESLTLSPFNKATHTVSGDTAWAPLIRSSQAHIILPLFGLEHSPFRFLLRDLKANFASDWFSAANRRERRWQSELEDLFSSRRWRVAARGVNLKHDGRILTDIDFLVFDEQKNAALLFQLKWQDPVGLDDKAKSSAARNFEREGNRWVEATSRWLETYGPEELGTRTGTRLNSETGILLIVIGRYTGPLFSADGLDQRSCWTDWATFLQSISSGSLSSLDQLCQDLNRRQQAVADPSYDESYAFPIGKLTVAFGMSLQD
ncbi:hypothetical protein [Roseovarius amoyensis]|uniref:hypothetical protein n=1 Tax=Roseovarius amoyensis TaxID=2211448 RepID=UPI0013A6AF38|nr:hypothetical protein [Roseovarius amoyensis]